MKYYDSKINKRLQETSNSYSFICEKPEGYDFRAGQHARWRFVCFDDLDEEEQERIFTISAAPEEDFLMFTTRIEEKHSPLKEKLLNELEEGAEIKISQPMGIYGIHEEEKASFSVAGGIGITPLRSIIKHLLEKPLEDHPVTLYYADDRGEFAFEDFFKEAEKKLPQLEVKFFDDGKVCGDETRKYAKEHGNDVEYLIAGSPGMNKFYEGLLDEEGIEEDSIVTDKFMGY